MLLAGKLEEILGDNDAYVARYDSEGNRLWLREFSPLARAEAEAIAPDGADGAMVAGFTEVGVGEGRDAFLARYDSAGNRLWIRRFGTSEADRAYALAPDGEGGMLVAGDTEGNLGGPSAGDNDVFLASYNGSGDQLWARQFGTPEVDIALAMCSDGAGGVVIAGETRGNLVGVNAGGRDTFLARHDASGDQLWVRQFGTSAHERCGAVVLDDAGVVTVAGKTGGSLGGPSAGDDDATRYDLEGNQLSILQFGTSSSDDAAVIARGDAGGMLVAGGTRGDLGGPNAGFSDVFVAGFRALGCSADLDGSGAVGLEDLIAVLAAWGNDGGPEDLDGDGTVGFGDVIELLVAWGPCA